MQYYGSFMKFPKTIKDLYPNHAEPEKLVSTVLVSLTNYVKFDDFVNGDGPSHLTLVEACVWHLGMPDPQHVLLGTGSVQGREPGVLDIGEVVQTQDLRDGVAVTQPWYLKKIIIY